MQETTSIIQKKSSINDFGTTESENLLMKAPYL